MSSIDKMAIRGIRSFSPFDEEKIEFYKPLTLIFGLKWCGENGKASFIAKQISIDHN
jgi:hypothetical protein